jgi:phytoene dehydrogenase-like protein
MPEPDAVVVGSGPNGLAAAVTLSAAGLSVLVVEGADTIGGGCRTEELTLPGFRHDVCSAAHPLAVVSPFFRRFGLAEHGVRFARPDVEFAHPLDGGRAGAAFRSVPETAAGLGEDAAAYRRVFGPIARGGERLCDLILQPIRRPPAPWPAGFAELARYGLRPATRLAGQFRTDEARALIAGAAGHAMRPLSAPLTGAIGLMITGLAHIGGWPLVAGGSARITDAMADAVVRRGGRIETGRWVRSLAELPRSRAVLLDLTPEALAGLAGDTLPPRYTRVLRRFRFGPGIFKIDWALDGPVPWASDACRRAGTIHLGGTFEEVAAAEAEVTAGRHPQSPYVLVVQPSVADPSRAPAGKHALWAYCHVPTGSDLDMTGRVEAQIERFAPGFGDLVLARATRTAAAVARHNPNYVGGDIGAGRQDVRQTLVGPALRWNPYRTALRGVYLCSSSVPPLPGVHGRCGELAALTALRDVFGICEPPDLRFPGTQPGAVSSGAGRRAAPDR